MDSSSLIRSRHCYTRHEDKMIIRYFLDTKDVSHLGGNEVWKRLQASAKYNPGKCSYHSLRERFLKKLKPNLSRFNLSRKEIELLSGKSTGRRNTASKSLEEDVGSPTPDRRTVEDRHEKSSEQPASRGESSSRRATQPESPQIDDASPPPKLPKATHRKRTLYRESTPALPENTSIGETSHTRYRSRLDPSRFLSDSSPSPSPPRSNGRERREENQDAAEKRRNRRLASTFSSDDELPPTRAEENITPRAEENVTPTPRICRVRSLDRPCNDEGGTSPVIETAPHKRKNKNIEDSDESLDGVMCGALVPTQSSSRGPAVTYESGPLVPVSYRTRSSCKARTADSSTAITPLGYFSDEPVTRSKPTTRHSLLRNIKQEKSDRNPEETLALVMPDSPSRVSTQDVLRNNVVDTQRESVESFYSAVQSPQRLRSAENVTKEHRSQKRKKQNAGIDDSERLKKTRRTAVSVNGDELHFPMNLKLKLPERESMTNAAEVAFLELVESMFKEHVETTWEPHDDCPGMDEFLFMCTNLREKVQELQLTRTGRELDAVIIDHYLHDLFDVPFCTWKRRNGRIDCNGAHRHFLASAQWMNSLNRLKDLYEAREIVKKMSG